jgi:predicted RND superfamily exporter protein
MFLITGVAMCVFTAIVLAPSTSRRSKDFFKKKRKENNCFIETGAQQGKACGCSGQDMHETYNATASISGFRTCMGYLSLCSEE